MCYTKIMNKLMNQKEKLEKLNNLYKFEIFSNIDIKYDEHLRKSIILFCYQNNIKIKKKYKIFINTKKHSYPTIQLGKVKKTLHRLVGEYKYGKLLNTNNVIHHIDSKYNCKIDKILLVTKHVHEIYHKIKDKINTRIKLNGK